MSSSSFDLRPQTLDLVATAGDSFTVKVTFAQPADFDLEDKMWVAQVRSTPGSATSLGEFEITPHATGVFLTLPADVSRDLWDSRPQGEDLFYQPDTNGGPGDDAWFSAIGLPQVYSDTWQGFWDLEMSTADRSVVTTLCGGKLSIQADVSR